MEVVLTDRNGYRRLLSDLIVNRYYSIYDIEDAIEDAIEKGGTDSKGTANAVAEKLNKLPLSVSFYAEKDNGTTMRLHGKDVFGNDRYLIIRR